MKPPKKIRVGPHTYRTVGDSDGLLVNANEFGHCDGGNLVIAYDTGQAPSALADTILHETLHACLTVLDIERAAEESVVHALTPMLLGVLRDNPKLLEFLLVSQ